MTGTNWLPCWRCGGTGREPDDPARRCTVCGGVGDVDESGEDADAEEWEDVT